MKWYNARNVIITDRRETDPVLVHPDYQGRGIAGKMIEYIKEKYKNNNLLTDMPVPSAFFKLAIPAIAAQLINILYNLVDKMFIGHIPCVGKQTLAGVGVTAPVILAISAFAVLVSMGGAPKASIFMGKGNNECAEKVMGSCTWLLILLSVVLTGIMLLWGKPILLLFGASSDTITYAVDYMQIYCLGTLFTQLTLGLNAFITAQGKTLISMCNVAVGAVTNIILDAVFINGIGMGVKGAALATVISQEVSACFVIHYLTTNKSMRVYLAMLFIYGIQVACQYSFVALDQAPKAIFLTIWRKIIILIPLIFILPQFVPNAVMGVYLAEPIADTIAVCTTAPMFYSYYRKLKC